LLEINPRFTLWHNAAAVAGVNIPALVYADLTGAPRPKTDRATIDVRWCKPWNDFRAALGSGVPPAEWVAWTLRCESKSVLSWRDPMQAVRSTLHRLQTPRDSAGAKNLKPRDWIGL